MQPSITSPHVSVLGRPQSVTSTPAATGNDPVADRKPGVGDRQPITGAGQERATGEESWADLAAAARADWAAENPV